MAKREVHIPGYKLTARIGEGGMGVVYRGRHGVIDREVAIKILHSHLTDDFYGNRLLAEAKAAAKLIHPNIVQVFDAGTAWDMPYIIMEFVRGVTVEQLLNMPERLGIPFVITVVSDAARGGIACAVV